MAQSKTYLINDSIDCVLCTSPSAPLIGHAGVAPAFPASLPLKDEQQNISPPSVILNILWVFYSKHKDYQTNWSDE